MASRDHDLLEEYSIHYSHVERLGFTKASYTSVHLPSGQEFEKEVWVLGPNILSLLMHWNNAGGTTWKIFSR